MGAVTAASDRRARLAAHTYSYRHLPLEDALDRLAGLGFSAVELWRGHAVDGPERGARSLAAAHMRAVAVSAGGFYDEDTAQARRSFELAHAVGAETVVACVAPRALRSLVPLVPGDLTLCVENHWDQPVRRHGDVVSLIARMSTARVAACLDTGHAILAGVRPERFAAVVASSLGHIHLKDARRPPVHQRALGVRLRRRLCSRPAPVGAGTGDLDVPRFLDVLDRIDYRAWITVEDEGSTDVASSLLALASAVVTTPDRTAAELHT